MSEQKRLDRPDREKIIEIIAAALSDNDVRPRADEILALIDKEIEEARKEAYNSGIIAGLEEKNRSIKEVVEEAKREERERIMSKMNRRDVGGVNPEWALSDKEYQALKETGG